MELPFLLAAFLSVFVLFIGFVWNKYLQPPSDFPTNLPVIPLYFSLLGYLTDRGQDELYNQYLRDPLNEFGAVIIFFGSRWNILVQRPSYLAEIFKNSGEYAKSGNQKKIPYSVVAALTGDNIISAHGDNWNLYRRIMKKGTQRKLDLQTVRSMRLKVGKVAGVLREQNNRGLEVVSLDNLIQRLSMDMLGVGMLETDFQTIEDPNARIFYLHNNIKKAIFNPLFLNFPILDRIIPTRWRIFKLIQQLEEELLSRTINICNTSSSSRTKRDTPTDIPLEPTSLITDMQDALFRSSWTRRQCLDNLKIIFIAGHENLHQHLVSLFFLLGTHPHAMQTLHKELSKAAHDAGHITNDPLSTEALDHLPYLTATCYEALRLLPPIPQLINRKTTDPVLLGGKIPIPEGTYVGWTAFGAHRDTSSPNPYPYSSTSLDKFDPSRWGNTIDEIRRVHRRTQARGEFVAFTGGMRACLGQAYADDVAKLVLDAMVRGVGMWEVVGKEDVKMTPGGLLRPRGLRIRFVEK
ncbi:cytochrome P450 [Ascobolus immersus RN42]|uniref:Cytochrome P450 n=1 Tax=Ascobolus immersus RN42 TaxID=1160509 RepID=A0A3N4I1N2_ASCIM|nr:cytochrome P450 [Ascobolus immersus RN42]